VKVFANRLLRFAAIPVLAALTLTAWVVASPVGASPDDDFHLVSAWCAGPTAAETCQRVAGEPQQREIPRALTLAPCYVADPDKSAGCQEGLFSNILNDTGASARGNFSRGGYPPVYYAAIGQFTTLDVQASVLTMRLVNIGVFLAFTVSLFWLLPRRLKPVLVGGWLITTVPLGLFIITSVNPGSWALTGVVSSWIALLGWFESTGRRKIALGVIFALAVVVAAGSRGDAAMFAGFGMVLAAVFAYRHDRRFWLDLILPFVMGLVALAFFFTSRQINSGLQGFGGGSTNAEQQLGGAGLFAYNVLNVPWLWAGTLGDWGLGWIYTDMPRVVPLAAIAAFVVVGAAGLAMLTKRKAILLAVMVIALWALPLWVLQAGGDAVGANVNPRYILPLVVLLGGMLLLQVNENRLRLSRAQRFAVGAALIGAHFVALYINIRRYVTGLDVGGFDLGANAEWWWQGPIGPNAVWLLGSLAYALLLIMILRNWSGGVALQATPTQLPASRIISA
jgi:hypothetical protein